MPGQRDPHLLLLCAENVHELEEALGGALGEAPDGTLGEQPDRTLGEEPDGTLEGVEGKPGRAREQWRAALVFAGPEERGRRAQTLRDWLAAPSERRLRAERGVFLGAGAQAPRIGVLFPGQGAPVHTGPGGLGLVCADAAEVFAAAGLRAGQEVTEEQVQLSVAASSIAALRAVRALGIDGELAIGHSLGELCALHWAGSLDEHALLRTARERGRAMTCEAIPPGAMLSVLGARERIERLLVASDGLSVACHNTPEQWVLSGPSAAIDLAGARAREEGVRAVRLKVTGAFHSPLMRAAAPIFAERLARERMLAPERRVLSTVTGAQLTQETNLHELLREQLTAPVLFAESVERAAAEVDLFVEVGPGRALSGMLSRWPGTEVSTPAVSVRAGEPTPGGLLEVAGAAYAAGTRVDLAPLESAGLLTCADARSAGMSDRAAAIRAGLAAPARSAQ